MSVFNNIIHNPAYKARVTQLPVMRATEGTALDLLSFLLAAAVLCFMFFVMNDPYLMEGLAAFVINGLDAVNNL